MPNVISRAVGRLQREIERTTWLYSQRRQGHRIHSTLEFTGLLPPYPRIQLGGNCCIERDVTLWFSPDAGADAKLSLGTEVFIGRNCYVGAFQPVEIGSYAIIGAYSYIISANHCYASREMPIKHQGFTGAPIVIGEDAWLGTRVTVLPGVTIGMGAIIAGGSVVNKNVPPYEVWGGMPARFLKARP